MKALWKDKLLLLVVAYLLVVLVAIPLTLVTLRKSTDSTTKASGSVALSYSPSPIQKVTAETFNLDVMIDPDVHLVSFVAIDISYDPTKLSIDENTAFQPNLEKFPMILEGPVFTPGRIRANLSIGNDPTKAINTTTKVATITFTAESPTSGQEDLVHFGESSVVLSVSPTDNATENVLNFVTPAQLTITGTDTGNGGPPVTPIPTFGGPTPTISDPTPTSDVPTPTVNITPQPTCTPFPPECLENDSLPICQDIPQGGYCDGDTTPTPTPVGQATPTPIACQKEIETDIMVVIDSSLSMHGDRIMNAKESAKSFITLLDSDPKNNYGVVSFDMTARLLNPLERNSVAAKNSIEQISLKKGTCTKCAIEIADDELSTNGRPDASKIMIILTDGRANVGGNGGGIEAAEEAALNVAKNSKTQNLVIYAIGIGDAVNQAFLEELAESKSGLYYFAAEPVEISEEFEALFNEISDDICKIPEIAATAYPSLTFPTAPNGSVDPATIILVILLFLPLFLLIGHLLV